MSKPVGQIGLERANVPLPEDQISGVYIDQPPENPS